MLGVALAAFFAAPCFEDRASGAYRALAPWAAHLATRPLFSDRPEALYYRGQQRGIYDAPRPTDVVHPALLKAKSAVPVLNVFPLALQHRKRFC